MTAWWLTGDTRAVMAQLPAGSVDLCLFSPPFLALRSYLPDDDPAKADEIGSEANPAEFIDTLLDVTEACARLLAPHGTLCVELGDTYSGSGGAGGDYAENGLRDGQAKFSGSKRQGNQRNDKVEMAAQGIIGTTSGERAKAFGGWPLPKSLALIPEAYRMALAYGRNPHNGRTTDPWRIRNVIRWVRPNPPVGALGDKFRPATSEMVVACKAKDRWFDLDAVRTPHAAASVTRSTSSAPRRMTSRVHATPGGDRESGGADGAPLDINPAGAPPLDWWDEIADIYQTAIETCAGDVRDGAKVARSIIAERYGSDAWEISPGGYSGTHYAVFPPELCVKPIEAMCPRRVCRTCGKPSRRLVDTEQVLHRADRADRKPYGPGSMAEGYQKRSTSVTTTTGWSTCGCPGADGIRLDGYHTGTGWRPGIVLDPFGGSGTTASVASGHSRDSISIDLDRRNADLARDRIGMWFAEITPADIAAGWMPHNPLSR
jgi:site-specific DNA-methyltransferase (adenine-specific)